MNLRRKAAHVENHSTSDIDIESTETPKKGLTRRQVAVGAAWAVPVVALAVGAPAQAASVPYVPGDPTTYPDPIQSGILQNPSDPSVKTKQNFNTQFFATATED